MYWLVELLYLSTTRCKQGLVYHINDVFVQICFTSCGGQIFKTLTRI